MSARRKIIIMLCAVLVGFGASIGLIFWSTGVDDLSIKKALTSQDIAIQALRVARNASEQLRDAREIILFGIDAHADFTTHKNYALSAFSKWGDYLEDYALLSGESSGAAAGTERKKSFLALKEQYNNIDAKLEIAIKSYQEGNQARASAELNTVALGDYDKEFLPGIEKEINTDRSLADDAKGKALDHSRFARRTSIIIIPVIALIVLVLSIILTRDIVSSIEKLKKGAEQLGEGNLTVRVDLDKRDEFGSLARAFNKMAQDLSDSRKELEIINAELAGFAHTVSHDLKGPLTAIMIAGSTLREALNAPEQESIEIDELLEIIEANIEKSSNLIDDVLSLAEAGQTPEVVSDVRVNEIVDGVLKERAPSIKEKGIKVMVGDSLGKVTANSTHIYQIFNNLLSNAIKHNDSDEPTIEVSHLGEDEAGEHRYLIKDNGSGIPEEDIDKVFVPFFKGKTGETGIGLSTVVKIIEVYGGDIKAYNDNGACFEFTLRDFRKE